MCVSQGENLEERYWVVIRVFCMRKETSWDRRERFRMPERCQTNNKGQEVLMSHSCAALPWCITVRECIYAGKVNPVTTAGEKSNSQMLAVSH